MTNNHLSKIFNPTNLDLKRHIEDIRSSSPYYPLRFVIILISVLKILTVISLAPRLPLFSYSIVIQIIGELLLWIGFYFSSQALLDVLDHLLYTYKKKELIASKNVLQKIQKEKTVIHKHGTDTNSNLPLS